MLTLLSLCPSVIYLTYMQLGQFQASLLAHPTYTFFISKEIKSGLLLTGPSQTRLEMTIFRSPNWSSDHFSYALRFLCTTQNVFSELIQCFLQLTHLLLIFILWDSDSKANVSLCASEYYIFTLYNLYFFQSSMLISDLKYKSYQN